MQTLSVSQIFSNLSYYEDNYLSILQNSAQYYINVDDVFVDVWPFRCQELYLGDLLQLWFSEKWRIQPQLDYNIFQSFSKTNSCSESEKYIYQIKGNVFKKLSSALVWCVINQKPQHIKLDSVLDYYCYFKTLQRPKISKNDLPNIQRQKIELF